jgi:hypothetical protein
MSMSEFNNDNQILVVKGPAFIEDFMGAMSSARGDIAQMVLASMVQKGEVDLGMMETPELAKRSCMAAFALADEFVFAQFESLNPVMSRYWDLFMARSQSSEEVLADFVEKAKDYSL